MIVRRDCKGIVVPQCGMSQSRAEEGLTNSVGDGKSWLLGGALQWSLGLCSSGILLQQQWDRMAWDRKKSIREKDQLEGYCEGRSKP